MAKYEIKAKSENNYMVRLAMTHTTYQDASALLVIVNGRQMQGGPAVLPALLDIDDIPVLTHDPQGLHLIQLGGQVHWRLFLLIQHSSIHWSVWVYQENIEALSGQINHGEATYIDKR